MKEMFKARIRIYLSQDFEDIPGSQILMGWENAQENVSFPVLFIYLESKEEKVRKVTWNLVVVN